MAQTRNSADDGRGNTSTDVVGDRDMVAAPAAAAATAGPDEAETEKVAVAGEASSPQVSALNSTPDGSGVERRGGNVWAGDETRSPTPSPSNSDCESHRGGKGRDGVVDLVVKTLTWTPRKLRYDPENPPQFTLALNFMFAVVSLSPCDQTKDMLIGCRRRRLRWPTSITTSRC